MNELGVGLLTSYTGLTTAIAVVVEILKVRITKGWFDGKEQFSALLLAPALGALAKLAKWGFTDVTWDTHITTCVLLGAIGAGLIHDKILNPVIGKSNK